MYTCYAILNLQNPIELYITYNCTMYKNVNDPYMFSCKYVDHKFIKYFLLKVIVTVNSSGCLQIGYRPLIEFKLFEFKSFKSFTSVSISLTTMSISLTTCPQVSNFCEFYGKFKFSFISPICRHPLDFTVTLSYDFTL